MTTTTPTTTETTMDRYTTLTKISRGLYITAADQTRMNHYAAYGQRGEWTVARLVLGGDMTVLGTATSIANAERLIATDRAA